MVDRVARSVTLHRSGALSHFGRNCAGVWRNPRRCSLCPSQRTPTARAVQRNRDVCDSVSEAKEISDACSQGKGGKSQTGSCAKNEAASHADARAEISEKEGGQRSIRQTCEIKVRSKRRGNAEAEKNTARAGRKRARHRRNRDLAATGDCGTNAAAFATTSASARRFSNWAGAGRDRKIRHRGGPGIRTCAITAAAPARFLAVESSSQLPLPNKLRN